MFKVEDSVLFGRDAKDLFSHIDTGEFWHGDYVVHAAARILYYNRASEEHPFKLVFSSNLTFQKDCVAVVYVNDWHECSKLKQDGKVVNAAGALKKFNVDCRAFINEELRAGIIAIQKDINYQYLVSLLPQMTPWFFRENLLAETEKELLLAALTSDSDKFNAIVQDFVNGIKLDAKIKTAQLEKFVGGLLEVKLKRLNEREERILSDMRNYEDRIRNLMAEYTEISSQIIGIKNSHDDDMAKEFAQAFAANKNCHISEISGAQITFVATGHLTNFSKPAYESLARATDSCLYSSCAYAGVSKTMFKQLMDEVILGKRYRINLSGKFKLDFGANNYTLCNTNSSTLHENAIPNPHITRYQCAGGFAAMYVEAFRSGDYLEVLDIVFSEVQNLNWTDYTVISVFANYLCSSYWRKSCIWDKAEQKYISPADLIKILEAEEKE